MPLAALKFPTFERHDIQLKYASARTATLARPEKLGDAPL
jgi:hypothetical protein